MFLSLGRLELGQRSLLPLWLALLLGSVASGCGENLEIRSYETPKKSSPRAEATSPMASAAEAVPSRMIAAIVLREGEAWFFKLSGEKPAVDEVAKEVRAFLGSLQLPEKEPSRLTWDVPERWTEGPDRPMRKATLLLPDTDTGKRLEIAISTLHFGGNDQPFLMANIQRWRDQIGLPKVEQLDADAGVEKLPLEGGEAWLFDAVGTRLPGGMGPMPPFAGAARNRPPTPPITSEPERQSVIHFDVPDHWTPLPRGSMGSRGFATGEGDLAVAIKAYDFPPIRAMADRLSNINRWRKEVGLANLVQDELADQTEAIDMDGVEGTLVDMAADDGSKATVAAMVEAQGRVWFFKMTGTKAGVDSHRDAFVTWIDSVRLTDASEGEE